MTTISSTATTTRGAAARDGACAHHVRAGDAVFIPPDGCTPQSTSRRTVGGGGSELFYDARPAQASELQRYCAYRQPSCGAVVRV